MAYISLAFKGHISVAWAESVGYKRIFFLNFVLNKVAQFFRHIRCTGIKDYGFAYIRCLRNTD